MDCIITGWPQPGRIFPHHPVWDSIYPGKFWGAVWHYYHHGDGFDFVNELSQTQRTANTAGSQNRQRRIAVGEHRIDSKP